MIVSNAVTFIETIKSPIYVASNRRSDLMDDVWWSSYLVVNTSMASDLVVVVEVE